MTTDNPKEADTSRNMEPWPFKSITPEQFYALPLAQRLAVQKMVRDMADSKKAEH